MSKIQFASRCLKITFLIILATSPLLFIYNNFIQHINFMTFPTNSGPVQWPLSEQNRYISVLLNLIPFVLNSYIAFCCIKLFSAYEKGKIFAYNKTSHIKKIDYDISAFIKRIGYSLILLAISSPINQMIMSYFITRHNNNLKQQILFNISSTQIVFLIAAIIAIVTAWIMQEGSLIKREYDTFI